MELLPAGAHLPPPPGAARYDGHADWYDQWSRSDGSPFMAGAEAALEELAPSNSGLAVDVGCGTGLRAKVAARHGYRVVGLDVSADQLRIARSRAPVVRADARALPLASGTAALTFSMLTHTDLDHFDRLVEECVRLLVPGGSFIYVGVHPCFNNPFAEPLADGVRLHTGYRKSGWQSQTTHRPGVIIHRVGAHHLPLDGLLRALLHPQAPIDRIIERGTGTIPDLLAVRLTKRATPRSAPAPTSSSDNTHDA